MYKSPITIESLHSRLVEEINEDTGERVYSAVLQQDISVDREELLRALQYDRGQYDAGYRDGIAAAEKKLVRCQDCEMQSSCKVAQHLGNDGFCSKGERRSDV